MSRVVGRWQLSVGWLKLGSLKDSASSPPPTLPPLALQKAVIYALVSPSTWTSKVPPNNYTGFPLHVGPFVGALGEVQVVDKASQVAFGEPEPSSCGGSDKLGRGEAGSYLGHQKYAKQKFFGPCLKPFWAVFNRFWAIILHTVGVRVEASGSTLLLMRWQSHQHPLPSTRDPIFQCPCLSIRPTYIMRIRPATFRHLTLNGSFLVLEWHPVIPVSVMTTLVCGPKSPRNCGDAEYVPNMFLRLLT